MVVEVPPSNRLTRTYDLILSAYLASLLIGTIIFLVMTTAQSLLHSTLFMQLSYVLVVALFLSVSIVPSVFLISGRRRHNLKYPVYFALTIWTIIFSMMLVFSVTSSTAGDEPIIGQPVFFSLLAANAIMFFICSRNYHHL